AASPQQLAGESARTVRRSHDRGRLWTRATAGQRDHIRAVWHVALGSDEHPTPPPGTRHDVLESQRRLSTGAGPPAPIRREDPWSGGSGMGRLGGTERLGNLLRADGTRVPLPWRIAAEAPATDREGPANNSGLEAAHAR